MGRARKYRPVCSVGDGFVIVLADKNLAKLTPASNLGQKYVGWWGAIRNRVQFVPGGGNDVG